MGRSISDILNIKKYHDLGYKGKGIKIAILDSGLGLDYLSLLNANSSDRQMNIVQVVDFTKGKDHKDAILSADARDSAVDENGHGTFVAGLIGSQNPKCPGIAPETDIYILKLFNEESMTYSAWFLDAFNFVLDNGIDIVNLSTASKDTQDSPFIEKIDELTAAGVIVVSAIGNDGPTQGTTESPADLQTVIGVGSLSYNFDRVAAFSSRGMTKKSMLINIGVPKPDVLLPGEEIMGLSLEPGVCKLNRGTSFSVPMLTGSIALVLSAIEQERGPEFRKSIQNTALIK